MSCIVKREFPRGYTFLLMSIVTDSFSNVLSEIGICDAWMLFRDPGTRDPTWAEGGISHDMLEAWQATYDRVTEALAELRGQEEAPFDSDDAQEIADALCKQGRLLAILQSLMSAPSAGGAYDCGGLRP